MPSSNAQSVSGQFPSPWAENIYLISQLVAHSDRYAAEHRNNRGRCSCCRHLWPCSGYRLAEQVVELQQRRAQ